MWRRSFVATTVALGGTIDDALAAIPTTSTSTISPLTNENSGGAAQLDDIVAGLRAKARPARAAALAAAVRDIVVAIDRTTLR